MRSSSEVLKSRFILEIAVASFTGALGALVAYGSTEFGTGWGDAGPQAGYFPFYIGIIIMMASAGVLLQALIQHRDRREAFLTHEQGRRILSFFGPMLAFVFLAHFLGLYVSLALYLFGAMVFQGGYRPLKAALISLASPLIFYAVFERWFQVPLLKGPLEAFLGIH